MNRTLYTAFREAIAAFRANFLHTILSMLGIVIGVAALVGILSLIDGMEAHANQQISATTSLRTLSVQPEQNRLVDGVRVPYDSTLRFDERDVALLQTELGPETLVFGRVVSQAIVRVVDDTTTTGALIAGVTWPVRSDSVALLSGRRLRATDGEHREKVAVINAPLAEKLREKTGRKEWIGAQLIVAEDTFAIVGVEAAAQAREPGAVILPSLSLPGLIRDRTGMTLSIDAPTVEEITTLRARIPAILARNHPGAEERMTMVYNQFRVEQMARGFLLFRIVMGFIVGLSVLVGGIGVMNVLLISVTERTREIGLRKAMGARKRDIVGQFMVESITIASVGSLCGLLLGMLATLGGVPLIRYFVEVEFPVVFSLGTLLTVVVVALFIGILFGTYPAVKAAGLDPVDAIRRE